METEIVKDNNNPEIELKYKISLEDVIEFNTKIVIQSMSKISRKLRFVGFFEIALSVFFMIIYAINMSKLSLTDIIAPVIVFIIGLITFSFGTVLFPRIITRSVKKMYKNTEYYSSEFTMSFFENNFTEKNNVVDNLIEYSEILRIEETQNLKILMTSETTGIIIPKNKASQTDLEQIEKLVLI